MNIVYIGNYRHPWCTEVHIARELEGLGHRVARFQEPSRPEVEALASIDQLVAEHDAGLVLYTRTWGGLPSSATGFWRRLEAEGVVTASYHLDLYLGLRREASLAGDPFWSTGHVFTPDGDPASAERFAELGINHHWSPPAVVSDECEMGSFRPELAYDATFVGSYDYHPEWPWRHQLVDWLVQNYAGRFKRFGGDTSPGPIRGEHLNDLYASAKVVVGDSLQLPCSTCGGSGYLPDNPTVACFPCGGTGRHRNYWSDRPYETVGRGGFLLMPRVPGLEQHFQDGRHLVFYDQGDLKGLRWLIDYWIGAPLEDRRLIAKTGQEHVRAHHTYRHRLAEALRVMGLT